MQENHTEEIAYELDRNPVNLRQWEDFDAEAWLREFPGCKNMRFWKAEPVHIPEPVIFDSVDELIRETDYPYTNVTRWPVMSKRMLETLLSVQEFPHQAIPVEMRDNELVIDKETGKLMPSGIENHDFAIVQILGWQDVFDWERSEYTPLEGVPGAVDHIKKLVLKASEEDLPPLFRMSACKSLLFVSRVAKKALEAADIRCVKFVPASKVRF